MINKLSELKIVIDKIGYEDICTNLDKKGYRERAIINGLFAAIMHKDCAVTIKAYSHSKYFYIKLLSKAKILRYITSKTLHDESDMVDYEVIDENPITLMIHIKVLLLKS